MTFASRLPAMQAWTSPTIALLVIRHFQTRLTGNRVRADEQVARHATDTSLRVRPPLQAAILQISIQAQRPTVVVRKFFLQFPERKDSRLNLQMLRPDEHAITLARNVFFQS